MVKSLCVTDFEVYVFKLEAVRSSNRRDVVVFSVGYLSADLGR